ncbi:MAG: bacillithiol biosynthesis deacetylase BshB1, partial [Psychroflexus salarius]
MKLDILAIGAHPDDVELSCAGTLIKEATKGKRVGVIDLTQGELGTRGNAETRAEEAKKAAEIMGLAIRKNLKFRDGFFKNDEAHQLEIIKLIRKYQPEIVFCNAIHDRHIDHSKGSQLVSDACFLSGLRKIETTHEDKIQEVWRPKHVYHYIQWYDITPDVVVNISGFISKKVEAVKAYKTQFFDPTNSEPKTPISSQNFLDSVTYRARDLGRIIGVDHAEGFTVERY